MKRILTFLLCIALAVSMLGLVSCTDALGGGNENGDTMEKLAGKTPEQLYAASQQKLKEAESFYVSATQDIVMTMGEGASMTIHQLVESKVNGDNSYMKTKNDLSSEFNIEAWYVDGVVYANTFGQKVKASLSKEKFMQDYMGADPSESTLLDIPESWFENVKFEKADEGWVLNFVVSGEKYTQVYENSGLTGATIIGNVDHKIYFDNDGNLQKFVASFDINVDGVNAHCDSVSLITIADVEIAPPADADTYKTVNIG